MRFVLDACVLYPTVMREVLIKCAQAGLFQPIWSARILEEWRRAAARHGADQEAQASGEIALLRAAFPKAEVDPSESLMRRLWLPDENDIHVLASAVASSADGIITLNAKDFPRHILAEEGLSRNDPDALVFGFHASEPVAVQALARNILDTANRMSGDVWTMRALMKKARLPRLGKALAQGA